ncbi:hypothetical protein YC2023_086742 [Brassica napus]
MPVLRFLTDLRNLGLQEQQAQVLEVDLVLCLNSSQKSVEACKNPPRMQQITSTYITSQANLTQTVGTQLTLIQHYKVHNSLSYKVTNSKTHNATRYTIHSPTSQPQQENKTTEFSKLVQHFTPLVDSQSAPTETTIMESSPSNITINAVLKTPVVDPLTTIPQAGAFESPSCFTVLGVMDEVGTEPMSSFSLTKGGKETKPPIKYQDI